MVACTTVIAHVRTPRAEGVEHSGRPAFSKTFRKENRCHDGLSAGKCLHSARSPYSTQSWQPGETAGKIWLNGIFVSRAREKTVRRLSRGLQPFHDRAVEPRIIEFGPEPRMP